MGGTVYTLADIRCPLYLYTCCMKTRANVCQNSSSSVFLSSCMAGSKEYLLDQGRKRTTISFSKSAAPLNIQIPPLRAMKGSFFQEKKGVVVIVFAICSSSTCSNTLIGSFEEPLCQRMKEQMPTVFRQHNSSARSNAPFATFLRVVFRTSKASLSTQI